MDSESGSELIEGSAWDVCAVSGCSHLGIYVGGFCGEHKDQHDHLAEPSQAGDSTPRAEPIFTWDCDECGDGIDVDEDGCCVTCGRDAHEICERRVSDRRLGTPPAAAEPEGDPVIGGFTIKDVELLEYLAYEAVGYGDGKLGPQDPEITAETENLAERIKAHLAPSSVSEGEPVAWQWREGPGHPWLDQLSPRTDAEGEIRPLYTHPSDSEGARAALDILREIVDGGVRIALPAGMLFRMDKVVKRAALASEPPAKDPATQFWGRYSKPPAQENEE